LVVTVALHTVGCCAGRIYGISNTRIIHQIESWVTHTTDGALEAVRTIGNGAGKFCTHLRG